MSVLMMCIGKVRMFVCQRLMRVQMAMAGAGRDRNVMLVLVVFVMHVFMLMHHALMDMFVFMTFGQMQPDSERHQAAGNKQRQRHRLAHQHGQQGAEERSDRKISSGARSAQVAQTDHE